MKTLLIILRWPLFFGLVISSILSGQAQLNSPQPLPRFIKVTETGNEVEIFGVAGRFYQAQGSLDLEEWFDLGDPILGEGEEITIEVESSADSFFVRFGMNDRDPNDFDGDGVPNETELANGTDQFHPDSDRDGISDLDDSFPLANQMAADPDGFNLPPSLERGLVWRWDFENVAVVGGKSRLPAKVRGERNFLEASNARGYRPGKGVVSAAVQLAPFGTVSAPKATPVLKFSRLYKIRTGLASFLNITRSLEMTALKMRVSASGCVLAQRVLISSRMI